MCIRDSLFSALCVATVSAQTDEKDNAMLNNGINFLDIPYVAHTLEVTDGDLCAALHIGSDIFAVGAGIGQKPFFIKGLRIVKGPVSYTHLQCFLPQW